MALEDGSRRTADDEPVRILGVDPGTFATGWGLLVGTSSRLRVGRCGVIVPRRDADLACRLLTLREGLEEVVAELHPELACVEAPFHGVNPRSALQLAHARGVVLAVLAGAGIPVSEIAPAAVKKALVGSGRADKDQVRHMVERVLGPFESPLRHDVSDALAVAWCRASTLKFERTVGRQGKRSTVGR